MTDSPTLTHVDPHGHAHMVDISGKPDSARTAVAAGRVVIGEAAYELVKENQLRKGDVLTVAQVAGILGAKKTSQLIPLCHHVLLHGIEVDLELAEDEPAVDIRAYAKTFGPTGVEMEAITAVSIAALTVYDMCKSVERGIRITDIRLIAKTGGQRGDYRREE